MPFLGRLHRNYGITQRETDKDLSPLMLVRVKSIELLEFVVNVGRHLQANQFESRPIRCLQTLNREVEVGVGADYLLFISSICKEGLKLLGLILHSIVVL